jgi:hypothetical protein
MFQKQLHPGNDLVFICIIQDEENWLPDQTQKRTGFNFITLFARL